MVFWGVYLKPNEPYTLHYDNDAIPKRLRITQATLGEATRNSPARSIVKCSIGDTPGVAICSLSVREMTCCQLDLEFDESHTVIFSVMGPRGVYLAGYIIAPSPTDHQHTIDHEGQEKTIMENTACSDHDLHEDKLEVSKTGLVQKSTEHCDKSINGRKHLLKCSQDKNREENIITTFDQKRGKDYNQDSTCSHEKYLNRQQICSSDEDQAKTLTVKLHSVFGRFLQEKRNAIEKKKRKKGNRKRKRRTLEATPTEHLTCKGNVKDDSFGKAKSKEQERKISKIVSTKKDD